MRAGLSGDRIPMEATFSPPVRTGPGAHPASCKMGIEVFFPGLKRPERGVHHSPIYSADVKEKAELYQHSPSGLSRPVIE